MRLGSTVKSRASLQSHRPRLIRVRLAGEVGRLLSQQGGVATVVGVDQPENCLRIRSGPGGDYDVIGCANMGDQLNITGVWTSNDWAQTADNGWVYGPQIQTDLRPPRTAYSQSPSYDVAEEVTPDYGDWAYLPDYGYDTYWYGGLPIYFYDIGRMEQIPPVVVASWPSGVVVAGRSSWQESLERHRIQITS